MGLSTCSQTWAGLPLPWGFRCVLGEMISGHISSVPSVVARQESHLCTFRTSHWATDLLLIFTSSFKEFYKYFIIGQSKVECISKEQYSFECASLRFSCKILSMIFFSLFYGVQIQLINMVLVLFNHVKFIVVVKKKRGIYFE